MKVHWFPVLGSIKNLTTGLIWLVTGGGEEEEACGGGPRRRGRWGGAQTAVSLGRKQCRSNEGARGEQGEAWGGGHQRAVHYLNWSDLAGEGGGGRGRLGGVGNFFT